MEYLQYYGGRGISMNFKNKVLNLVINGIPSIPLYQFQYPTNHRCSFKPCYKWNTFNTVTDFIGINNVGVVLNLVINRIPSIQGNISHLHYGLIVLNLVINGIPSILWWKGHFYEF